MPSRRPLRRPPAAAPGTLLATWADGTVHLWGWDGRQTLPPVWLDRTLGATLPTGRFSSLDVRLADGRSLRPGTLRLDADTVGPWLRALPTRLSAGAPIAWLRAAAELAATAVGAGYVTPVVRPERDVLVARWQPVGVPALDEALGALAAAMPAIVRPRPDDPTTVADIHAVLVDSVARHRLAAARWRPQPTGRSPVAAATSRVFRALAGRDPRLPATAPEAAVAGVTIALERRRRRLRGEPVVVPRVRLVVPDDVGDDWVAALELVDELDPGRWCTADDVWSTSPLAVELAGDVAHVDVLARELVAAAGAMAAARRCPRSPGDHRPTLGPPVRPRGRRAVPRAGTGRARAPRRRAGRTGAAGAGLRLHQGRGDAGEPVRAAGRLREGGDRRVAPRRRGRRRAAGGDGGRAGAGRGGRGDAVDTRAGGGSASTRPPFAGPGSAWRTTPAATPASTPSPCSPWPRTASSTDLSTAVESATAPGGRPSCWPASPTTASSSRPRDRASGASCGRTSAAASVGCGSSSASAWVGAWPTTWASARRRPPWPTCWSGRAHTSWCARCRSCTTGSPRRPASPPTLQVVVHHGAERAEALGADQLVPADVVVTTYGLLPRDIDRLAAVEWSTVVLDEAQMVKNPATRAAQAVRALPSGSEAGPHRHARREPVGRAVGHPRRREPRACSAAASSSATATPARSSARATPPPRPGCGASPSRSCCGAPRPTASSSPTCRTRSSRSPGPGCRGSRPRCTATSSSSSSPTPPRPPG